VWDSGVRKALKLAAAAEGCDFPGFGPHSLRRATEEHTVVQLRRQDELTRRIQGKRMKAGKRGKAKLVEITRPDAAA
jgi:hypothetical protein